MVLDKVSWQASSTEPDHLVPFNHCEQGFLGTHEGGDGDPYEIVGFMFLVRDSVQFC